MTGGDWHDPFAEDQAAQERERRRAEREARRRERQQSLGEKVGEAQAATQTPEQSPAEAPPAPPAGADGDGAPAAAQPTAVHRPRAGAAPATAAGRKRPATAAALRRAARHDHGPQNIWLRRAIGILLLIAVCALIVVAALAVIDRITGGGEEAPERQRNALAPGKEVVVPEGLDRRQIVDVVKDEGLKGDYAEASKSFKGFDPGKYGAEDAPHLEGFLFPATYEVPKKGSANDLVERQLQAFQDNLAQVDLSHAKSKNLSVYDVLKIASMVEREIMVPEERPLAAAVIYNRLKAGDTLGIDATLRYYLQNYDQQLTESELADPHPYNTRVNPGLPPTPIGNPGLASIEAAANPAKSDAYYFVVKPGTCGEHVFVETEEEFAQAEAEYQTALQEQGGSPTDC
jgi:cell division protein YceG involved in septum cleavage